MARLRASRYLTCFYCGKRTGTKYSASVREFLCTNCEATNYLDENGEITDPPVATEREAPATQYAVSKPSPTPPSSQADSIFCATCIKNQRLFTASLAQYLPEDPSHPDYQQRERDYYRYRKALEARYPQVCEDCAEKVDGRIRQAGYTAKTDHLRRMMDKSRGMKAPQRTSVLDWVSGLGRWLWWAGLVLQMMWHLVIVSEVLGQTDDGMRDPDDQSIEIKAIAALNQAVAYMPTPETLIQGSITASILCVWWNPHFVQFNRGFTRHLLGFTQWYSFQGLIIFFRFVFRGVLEMEGGQAHSRSAQLGAHLTMAGGMSLIYILASRSIKIDTTPLFGTYEGTVSPKQARSPAQKKQEDSRTFSELLNDALDSPTPTPQPAALARTPQKPLSAPRTFNQTLGSQSSQLSFDSLGLNDPAPQQEPVQYDDEMDWTPTQSQHRAFSKSSLPNPGSKPLHFGDAPVKPDGGAFWYKAPPAPVHPARQLRNPPNAPVLRKAAAKETAFFRGSTAGRGTTPDEVESGVSFKQPKFFASSQENDEANSLADMLSQSFSLGQEQDNAPATPPKPSMWKAAGQHRPRRASALEPSILAVLVALWLVTSFIDIPYGAESQLATLAVAGILALRLTGETNSAGQQSLGAAAYVGSALGAVELAALCWIGWEAWRGQRDVGGYGLGVLGVMLGHQVWNRVW